MSDERVWRKALGGLYARGDIIASKYRLDRVVGVGGMGVVVEAYHLELEQKVAVKLLRPTRTSDDNRERFRREARAAFRLTSEHAVRILDLGQHGETLYMAMELLDGSDFGQILETHGRLAVPTAVGYILQVCEAVAEAHAVGVVHRDLKPENLFLCTRADGTPCVKVLDFGLAKLRGGSRASLTRVNRGMGTPHYMAPEQWLSARDVGPGADIWGIGVILFQLVSGAKPFDDEDEGALCQSVLFGAPTDLDRFVPNPPPGLTEVIMKCLEKKPQHRFLSVGDLAAALLPYAPRGPVEVLSSDEIPVPGVAAGWGLSLSEPSKTMVDAVRHEAEHETLTALRTPASFRSGSEQPPPRAGETAEAMPPSLRPPAMNDDFDAMSSLGDEPSEDTSEPVVGEVPARQTERPLVLWALSAVVLGGIAAALVFGGVLDRAVGSTAEPGTGEVAPTPPPPPTAKVVAPEPVTSAEPGEREDREGAEAEEAAAGGGDATAAEDAAGGAAAADADAAGDEEEPDEDEKADKPKPRPRIYYRPRPRPKPEPSDIYEDI